MDSSEATDMEDKAANLKAARARRARLLRRRIVAGALALFVATWLLIPVTLASGHDPVLSRKVTASVASTTTTAAATTSAQAATTKTTTTTTTAATTTAPSAVSTSQS
jgi:hypothetical protein